MFNKGLEIIEARWLFDIPPENIEVLIHPQSIVHSIVEFSDGSQIAQMSVPDMRLPIQYALTYPLRFPSPVRRLNLYEKGRLDFHSVPEGKFPALDLALSALKTGGLATTVLNASDEVSVELFIKKRIKFTQIADIIKASLKKFEPYDNPFPSLDEIINTDVKVREFIYSGFGLGS
jgi:1-deoxy-D-xylulose-5-phosphate reductoisomerase